MARGRMLATSIADDKRFNALPVDAALVYLMAIPQLDRDGLILGDPMSLWGQVCRRRPDLMPRMEAIIDEWVQSGLVTAYQGDDGDVILHFKGFQKNQSMTHYDREAASHFPCPPGYTRTKKALVPDGIQQADKTQSEDVRSESGASPDEVLPNINKSNVNKNNGTDANAGSGGGREVEQAKAVYACWEDNMPGTLTPMIADELAEDIATYGAEEVIHAIGVAVSAGKRSMRYVQGVLRNRATGNEPHKNGKAPQTVPALPADVVRLMAQ